MVITDYRQVTAANIPAKPRWKRAAGVGVTIIGVSYVYAYLCDRTLVWYRERKVAGLQKEIEALKAKAVEDDSLIEELQRRQMRPA